MKKFELLYTPKAGDLTAVDQAIAAALETQEKTVFFYRYFASESSGAILISNDIPKGQYSKGGRLRITLEPAAIPPKSFSFSTTGGAALVSPLLGTVHRALLSCLELVDEPISALELQDLKVLRVHMEVPFLAETEVEAGQLLMSLAQHLKVAMDMGNPMPSKKWVLPKKSAPRVQWSEVNKKVLEVTLPFGALRVFIAADGDHANSRFLNTNDEALRAHRVSMLRRLVCFEIDADVSLVTDPLDESATLPPNLDRWLPSGMSINPYLFIWTAFTWKAWLNLDLATDEVDVEGAQLTDAQRDLLQWYFDGRVVKEHDAINLDFDRFFAFRRALIVKAGVDLLNPWRYFRLNLAKTLRPTINYEVRLKVDASEFAEATFTTAIAAEVGAALDEDTRVGRGSWL